MTDHVSTAHFLQVADLLPEALLLVSGDGTVLAANPGAGARLGLAPERIAGRPLAELVADPPDAVAQYLRACAGSREMLPGALRVKGGEGRETACHCEGAVYRPRSDGEPALVLLRLTPQAAAGPFVALNQRIAELSKEILRRRRAEEEARDQREWLRVTLASIGDAVIATDTQGHVTFMNPIAEALTGWEQAQAADKPLKDVFHIVHEETRQPVENPVARVLREGLIVGLANHTVLLARGGKEIPIDDCAAPIRRDGEGVAGVVMVFHDVTARRELERALNRQNDRLREADRRKDEFLAMLSHELRNPLAPIRNGLQILELAAGDALTVRQTREMMGRQVQHLTRLVDDLLDVSRITRGRITLKKEPVALAAVLERAVEAVRPLMDERRHELTVTLPPRSLRVEADVVRLTQVLTNLLGNAAQYTEPGGRVALAGEADGGEAVVRVRDTGVGMPPELIPQMFELFTQAERPLDRSQGGLGVGLSVVRSLVQMHGGSVRALSEGPGKGSEFVIRLPALPEPPPGQGAAGPGKRHVLIVDDLSDSAESLAMVLGLLGYDVTTAADGPAGLAAARARRPDVVLLDIGLPSMDGYEVARRLRELPGLERVLLVAVTGYGQDEDRRKARQAGFDHHLTKPVDPEALQALLARTFLV